MFAKACKICQHFKKRRNLYGHLRPKKIEEIKPWYLVSVYLIGPYSKSIRKQHPGGAIISNNSSLTCMTMIDTVTGWFKIVEIPMFDPDEVTTGNE